MYIIYILYKCKALVDVQWFLDCHGRFCMKSWRCFCYDLPKASHLSSRQWLAWLVTVAMFFLMQEKADVRTTVVETHHLNMKKLHDVGCFFQAVEEWLQPMIMFGIPRCHSLLLPFCNVGHFPFSGPSREVAAPRWFCCWQVCCLRILEVTMRWFSTLLLLLLL